MSHRYFWPFCRYNINSKDTFFDNATRSRIVSLFCFARENSVHSEWYNVIRALWLLRREHDIQYKREQKLFASSRRLPSLGTVLGNQFRREFSRNNFQVYCLLVSLSLFLSLAVCLRCMKSSDALPAHGPAKPWVSNTLIHNLSTD